MKKKKLGNEPPQFGKWLLKSFCSYDFLSTALWDLEEIYNNNLKHKGKTKANLLYLWHAIGVCYHLYSKGKTHYAPNRIAMLKNNIIVSFRNFKRNKVYTFLNVLGLTSGLIVFILIRVYTTHEFSYDQYHEHKDNIYRIYKEEVGVSFLGSTLDTGTPPPLATALITDFPEVINSIRLYSNSNVLTKVNKQTFLEPVVHVVDPQIFQMFSFEVIAGDISNFLAAKNTVVLSESAAAKYFGNKDVVGNVIYYQNEHPMQVVGVIQDMPTNSHFTMDVIFQFETIMELNGSSLTNWRQNSYHTYLMLRDNVDPKEFQAKLPALKAKYTDDPIDEDGQRTIYHLQPLSEIHFARGVLGEIAPTSNRQQLYTYLGIAFMILLIAGINYVNIATAQIVKRTREIGIRKVVGAKSRNLIFQFLLESIVIVSIALIIALVSVLLILPNFSQFVSRDLTLDFGAPQLWLFLATLCLGLGVLAGIYPAIILSSFRPVLALKGKGQSLGRTTIRNVLVVFQFAISATLILGTFVLSKQLNYIQNMDMGYTRDQVVVFRIRDKNVRRQLQVFKEDLRKIQGVTYVTSSSDLPNQIGSATYATWPGKAQEEEFLVYQSLADYDFVDLYGLEVIEGRNFSRDIHSDKKGILLNEAAVKLLGWEEPIGRQMKMAWSSDTGRVIGVLKDFHQHSVHLEIKPLQVSFSNAYNLISVKILGTQLIETLEAVESGYNSFSPEYPFEYHYFDDIFDSAYLTETKTGQLANWFAGLTILVACLGLYGLASYKVEQSIKEVGIRKVLGASVPKILVLLSRDFAKLLVIAFLIAAPIAYYVMDGWLNNFAYHVSIGGLSFALTLIIMILIAGLAVGHRTYMAAVRNPVESLRDE